MIRLRPNNRRRRGNIVVEFALATSLMVPLLAGTFQFGYSMYAYNSLQNAALAGARFASLLPYTSTTSTPTADYMNQVKNMVVYGAPVVTQAGGNANGGENGINTGPAPFVRNLTPANVDVSVIMNGGVPAKVTVKIINFTVDGVFKTFTFNKPIVTFPYNGA